MEIINNLVNNIALLLSLWVIYVLLSGRVNRLRPTNEKIIIGLSVGLIGLGIMAAPLILAPGLVFDTRSVLLSISGLYFGTVPTVIAAVIAGTYRLIAGGAGALPGVGVIITSTAIGLGARVICRRRGREIKPYGLYLMGLVVHIVMLLQLWITLPQNYATEFLSEVSLPIIILYPVATVLIGLLFLLQQTRLAQSRKLVESESRYRLLFETVPDALFVLDAKGSFVDLNSVAVDRYGYTEEEFEQMTVSDLAAPDLKDQASARLNQVLERGGTFEWWHQRKDGSLIPGRDQCKPNCPG